MNFNKEIKTLKIYKYWFYRFIKSENKEKFIKMCKEEYSIPTQKIIISALKHYLNNDFSKNLSFPKNHDYSREIVVSKTEYKKVMDNLIFYDFLTSFRNKKIIEILWYTGIRVGELLNLKWKDYSNELLKIKGKGNKNRIIPMPNFILKDFPKNSDYIFCSKKGRQLSYSSIVKIFYCVKEILNRNEVSAHSFRHSFATRLLKKEIDITYISKLLGHSSLNMTEKYIHWNMNDIKKILSEKDWH